jgi:hypothetical protein
MAQRFACYGFGGIPKFQENHGDKVSNCFYLSGKADPVIEGIQNVITTYREKVKDIEFSNPTCYAPSLGALLEYCKICKAQNMKLYHVMLLLSDGNIEDYSETVDMIVKLSKEPVSIIIVGLGKSATGFAEMKKLDND